MTTLILVRHGESEWNRAGRIQGQVNSPLTDLGISQAIAISNYLSGIFINQELKIYTSPLDRAIQTAKIIAQGIDCFGSELIIEERLNDFNLGEISGTFGWDKVAEIFPEQAKLRLQDPMRFHPSGGESGADFEARLRSLLEDLMDDGTLKLMVSHGIVNKFIRGILKNLSGKEMINLGESQNTIYRLEQGEETEIKIPPSNREKN
ncbi:MAG: histidine phosphatase family protein [SAR324 cluster bacterium]|nr:histidine phosphatase family protein [SAR324 cluster bacterium]MEC9011875.1 histidine phosphatase family protein [SAR324 cluster bacterium]MED5435707.1 histidine phosphatase family protein [SAR324 cluster bacterium]